MLAIRVEVTVAAPQVDSKLHREIVVSRHWDRYATTKTYEAALGDPTGSKILGSRRSDRQVFAPHEAQPTHASFPLASSVPKFNPHTGTIAKFFGFGWSRRSP